MQVLHLNTENGWRGGERQTMLTLLGLKSRGVRVGLIAQPDGPLIKAAADADIDVIPVKMRGGFDALAIMRLAKIFRRSKTGLIHAQTAHAAGLAVLARGWGWRKRPKLVVSRRVDFRIKSRWKYNRADAVVPISNAIKTILLDCAVKPERIHVIPSGIPVNIKVPGNAAGLRRELAGDAQVVIGAVGHLTEHKGHKYLIGAFARVLDVYPGARLVIVGDGELRGELERLARDSGLERAINFTGFREDAADLILAFDVLVHPSILEGLCTTLFDAMLRSVPVVASKVGGIPEALNNGEFGLLAPPADPEILAEAIVRILADKSVREGLVTGAVEWVKANFSADRMVDRTLELYNDLLK